VAGAASAPPDALTKCGCSADPGINTLLRLAVVYMVKDMRTTREQKEANTVHANKGQATLKLETPRWLVRPSAARIERNLLWSQPSHVAMSLRLGISYSFGTRQVPV
jgi:hypothetical protein